MQLSQFDYDLPPELIAQTPIEPRHASRLMVLHRATGQISHHTFMDLVDFLSPGDLLIANNSRVMPARLLGQKESGGRVEILLLKRINDLQWEALVGGKRLRPGTVVKIKNQTSQVFETCKVLADLGDARRLIEFAMPIDALLPQLGHVPLPPYIHTALPDPERYQTVFSRVDGSAAAPTAGLHFSPELLLALRDKGVGLDYVTLHIGLDTFKPVTEEQIEQHEIHREFASLTAETAQHINQTKLAGGRVVAVGTTSVRTLETAARGGTLKGDSSTCPWQTVTAIAEETNLFIYPGYNFKAVDVLLTNFHLPKSTLLMLVSAFGGFDFVKQAYQIAMSEKYRFYSFGDAMLIL